MNDQALELQGWKDAKRHLLAAKKDVLTALNHILTAAESLPRDGHNLGVEFLVISGLDGLTDELTGMNVLIKSIGGALRRRLRELETEVTR